MTVTSTKFLIAAILLSCPSAAWAQQGTINRKVILRRDPTTSSPALAHLTQGARVTLVGATADAGFLHVKTEDDQVGWVFAKYISVSAAPTPTPADVAAATGAQCDTNLWNHVYHPQRLIVQKQCTEVTGTIVDATNGKQSDGVRH